MVQRQNELPENAPSVSKLMGSSGGPASASTAAGSLARGVAASAYAAVREYFVTKPALMNLPRTTPRTSHFSSTALGIRVVPILPILLYFYFVCADIYEPLYKYCKMVEGKTEYGTTYPDAYIHYI